MPKRTLQIDMSELELVFDNHHAEFSSYLNLDTGEILIVNDAIEAQLETIQLELTPDEDLINHLNGLGLGEGTRRELLAQAAFERAPLGTYLRIPQADSQQGYVDMQTFIETLPDGPVARKLAMAIQGSGAFRRFRELVARDPALQSAWLTFHDQMRRQRITAWLDGNDIQPTLLRHL